MLDVFMHFVSDAEQQLSRNERTASFAAKDASSLAGFDHPRFDCASLRLHPLGWRAHVHGTSEAASAAASRRGVLVTSLLLTFRCFHFFLAVCLKV